MESDDTEPPKAVVVSGRSPLVNCLRCQTSFFQCEYIFEKWFTTGGAPCPYCQGTYDLRASLVRSLTVKPSSALNACRVGARSAESVFVMPQGGRVELSLADIGVPGGARLLYLGVTPYNGAGWPILSSLGRIFPVDDIGETFTLYGRPHEAYVDGQAVSPGIDPYAPPTSRWYWAPDEEQEGVTFAEVMGRESVLMTAVYCAGDDVPQRQLALAAMAYQSGRLDDIVIPANIAAELTITSLVQSVVRDRCAKKHTDGFFDAVTYGHQLNVMLRLCAELVGAAPLADDVRGSLNRLKDLRNDMAHRAAARQKLLVSDGAELIVAALLAVEYCGYLDRKIRGEVAEPPQPPESAEWPV